ncbi:hypothetical protein [Streptomyces sp. NBC_01483]|uniref:hypothetical protein n=1 Tax=Streptomyces sp. NBC_01483 TaxID=2903883 RepID=UPI002E35C543|nr:hypothetical protein [Streptomyces sp. NBC_01483]
MTTRRTLGTGPEAPAQNIRAAQTGLLDALPGVHLPDLSELRARGVLGTHPTAPPSPRRTLSAGRTNDAVPNPDDGGGRLGWVRLVSRDA